MDERVKNYFQNPRKLIDVKAKKGYTLLLTFDNGEVKRYEMINELYGVFKVLKDIKKFESVFIDEVGNVAWNIDDNIDSAIHWDNRIDLCKDMLYMESIPEVDALPDEVESIKNDNDEEVIDMIPQKCDIYVE